MLVFQMTSRRLVVLGRLTNLPVKQKRNGGTRLLNTQSALARVNSALK